MMLWCYHAYADALIMMLCCYHFYDVTMLMILLCCGHHELSLFHKCMFDCCTGDSLVDQYPSTLVHIVGFKFLKNQANILQVLGEIRGLRWEGGKGIYKD